MLLILFSYFTALSEGEPLPVKDRLEISAKTPNTESTLTPGLLKVLHEQVRLFQLYSFTHVMFISCILNTYLFWKI